MLKDESQISRQARWQRKHRAMGLCVLCSRPAFKGWRCKKHYEQHKITMRLRYIPKVRGRYKVGGTALAEPAAKRRSKVASAKKKTSSATTSKKRTASKKAASGKSTKRTTAKKATRARATSKAPAKKKTAGTRKKTSTLQKKSSTRGTRKVGRS